MTWASRKPDNITLVQPSS